MFYLNLGVATSYPMYNIPSIPSTLPGQTHPYFPPITTHSTNNTPMDSLQRLAKNGPTVIKSPPIKVPINAFRCLCTDIICSVNMCVR